MRIIKLKRRAISMRTPLIFLLLCLGLQACAGGSNGNQQPENAPSDTPVAAIIATDTLQPTPTAATPLAVLVSPAGSDPRQSETVARVMGELAAQDGLEFRNVSSISELDFDDTLEIVALLAPDPGVTQLAADHPQVQFLGINIPDLQTGENLSSIGAQGDRPDRQGFLAGYLAAVITDDWRIGVISPQDSTDGQASRLGFLNGGIFYCGLCRPVYPPFIQYPQFVEIPAGAGLAERQAAADSLIANGVKTAYVYPRAGDDGLLSYLVQNGLNIIAGVPPAEELQERWVATIETDLAAGLNEIWPALVDGTGGVSLAIPIIISHRNEQLFSLGRQALVEKLLAELSADYVDTGVDPLTGTLK